MSHYDNPLVITYGLGDHDFGAAGDALAIKPPPGVSRGRIVDIHVAVKETFTATTTPAFIRLGTAADPDYYAELNMGTAADTDAYSIRNIAGGYDAVVFRSIDLVQDAVSQVEVVFVAPTGGTPAGIGSVSIAIAWW